MIKYFIVALIAVVGIALSHSPKAGADSCVMAMAEVGCSASHSGGNHMRRGQIRRADRQHRRAAKRADRAARKAERRGSCGYAEASCAGVQRASCARRAACSVALVRVAAPAVEVQVSAPCPNCD